MRSLGTAIGAGVLLVVLAACATSTPVGPGAGGPTLTTEVSSETPATTPGEPEFESPVPPNGKEVPKERIDAAAIPEGTPTTTWTEGDGSVLGVIAQEAGCGKASVEIAEQNAQVVKVVLVETTPLDQPVCTMDIRYPPLTAKLDAPLGDRKVVLSTRQDQK
ncbi:hypothetical protein IOD16_05640 [Saccharothrix sp. 6-C]|uniref:Uncharacterized protein n=1 Tax=Saccharothrix texasensis TaxID=103734 RepID=A0A3N1H4W6_9PSEU|nr:MULTISPECIES: hypothetical protein [Saccharothrix]QQQ77972.1 hypothetical protein IOD16_05640 [Saccharothrix sp. 6-C]ROP37557.1 hypothetical protein EDD40_2874 [Saccharothrix texasensis]